MEQIKCPKCGKPAKEVVYMKKKVRRGWYCGHCRHFEKAIGRESKYEQEYY